MDLTLHLLLSLFYAYCFSLDISAELSDSEEANVQQILIPHSRTKRGNADLENAFYTMCRSKCWDEWTTWTACSGPCNTGSRTRTRKRKTPPPECRNVGCIGSGSQNQQCIMDCGVGGVSAADHCACLPGYEGSCCKERITCQRPPKPTNGYLSGNEIWPAYYDAVVVYHCDSGYALIGQEQRRCQANRLWSGSNPDCRIITCEGPLPIANGKIINRKSEYLYGTTIAYECDIGYQIVGATSRQCIVDQSGHGKWNIHPPTCAARQCGDPGTLRNGHRSGTDFSFNGLVVFTCGSGYTLIGSETRRCLSTGTWSGSQPVCKEVLCPMMENPAHGFISSSGSLVNTVVIFSCDRGYRLEGDEYLACLPNVIWNGTVPQCKAIGCEHPGNPSNGAVENNGLLLGNTVKFYCHSGYVISGSKEATCQADGSWSQRPPLCEACGLNSYKTGPADGGSCVSCPANSHTVTIATANRNHCICNNGFSGNPGGPCGVITCGIPSAPLNGRIVSCRDGYGMKCIFDCNDGYIIHKGSSVRTCLHNGNWDGHHTVCQACPRDTYKAGPSVCLPCPHHSSTSGAANSINQCKCIEGYQGETGQECTDINECTTGTHKCQQTCTNEIGGYTCDCNIPGYKLNIDLRTCRPENQCKNLTENDAPENGGLLCHHYWEQNSKMCSIRCNPGYELAVRSNSYETCGPVTGYIWSYKKVFVLGSPSVTIDDSLLLPPCIEQFFPEFLLLANSDFFVRACKQLNETEKFVAKREFARTLTEQGVCWQRNTKVCDMRNVEIICGTEFRRRKRGTDYEDIAVDVVNIQFNITANKTEDHASNCQSKICPMLRIPAMHCDRFCLPAYTRFLRGAVMYAKNQITNLFENQRESLSFQVADRLFSPSEDNDILSVSDVLENCDEGMMSREGMCVPCNPGTYFSAEDNDCLPCGVGYFQGDSKQTKCEKCPVGTETVKEGLSNCTVCKEGTYGEGCSMKCGTCINGTCDPISGSCVCHSGWEGNKCDQDIPGCKEGGCYEGVSCTDVVAPGTGFICGSCPPNMTGNGIYCTSLSDSS